MEKLTFKIEIPYDKIRQMACRIHGQLWTDEQIFEYFKKRKTLSVKEEEISKIEESAFEVFTALSIALIETRNNNKK